MMMTSIPQQYIPQGFSRVSQNGAWNNAIAQNNYDLSQINTAYGKNRFDVTNGAAGKVYQQGGFSGVINNTGNGYLNAFQKDSTWAMVNSQNGAPFDITQTGTFGSFANVAGGGTINQDHSAYVTSWVGPGSGATINQNNAYMGTTYTNQAGVTLNQDKLEYATFVQNQGGGTFNQNAGTQALGYVTDGGGTYNQTSQNNAIQLERSGGTVNQTGRSSLAYMIDSGTTLNQTGGYWATGVQFGGGSKAYQGNTINDFYALGGGATVDQGGKDAYQNRLVNTGSTKFSQNAIGDNIVWNNGGGVEGSQTSTSGVNWAVL